MERIKDNLVKFYLKQGLYFRNHDLPATISQDKIQWHSRMKYNRVRDLPSNIFKHGEKQWFIPPHGLFHREQNLPACICANGERVWFKEGVLTKKLTFRN